MAVIAAGVFIGGAMLWCAETAFWLAGRVVAGLWSFLRPRGKGAARASAVTAAVVLVGVVSPARADLSLPAGYPNIVNVQVTGSGEYDGSYGLVWHEQFEGYQSADASAYPSFQLTPDGYGSVNVADGGASFSGTWTDGAWTFGSWGGSWGGGTAFDSASLVTQYGSGSGGGGSNGGGSTPEPGGVAAGFFMACSILSRRSRRGLEQASRRSRLQPSV